MHKRRPRRDREPPPSEPLERTNAHRTTPEIRRRNFEHAKKRIKHKIEEMSVFDVALYLYEHRSRKDDLYLFAAAKLYLTKDAEYFTDDDGNPERRIMWCVFQNASCADSLETFIQLNYRENFHPT